MEDNLVSVIIASYNHEKYIQETLQSIINQTYKNIELILIDDGSKDSTYEKVLEMKPQLEERFVNLHIEKQKNMGSARTINKLVKYSNSNYLYMIASDDVAQEKAIEVLYNFLSKNDDFGLVAGNSKMIDQKSKFILMDENREIVSKSSYHSFETYNEYTRERLSRLYGKKIGNRYDWENLDYVKYSDFWFDNCIPQGYLVRKEAFNKILPYSVNSPLEDVFLHYQITKFFKEKVLPDILFYYRLHPKNTMKNMDYVERIAKITRLYELYLLDTKYPEFKTKELKESWWYKIHEEEWEESKNSPLWDEEYYTKKYPEVLEQGWVPLVHYICVGSKKKYLPSKYFESIFHPVHKNNMLLKRNRKLFKSLKLKQRFKLIYYGFMVILSQLFIVDLILNKKVRQHFHKSINKYWR